MEIYLEFEYLYIISLIGLFGGTCISEWFLSRNCGLRYANIKAFILLFQLTQSECSVSVQYERSREGEGWHRQTGLREDGDLQADLRYI